MSADATVLTSWEISLDTRITDGRQMKIRHVVSTVVVLTAHNKFFWAQLENFQHD